MMYGVAVSAYLIFQDSAFRFRAHAGLDLIKKIHLARVLVSYVDIRTSIVAAASPNDRAHSLGAHKYAHEVALGRLGYQQRVNSTCRQLIHEPLGSGEIMLADKNGDPHVFLHETFCNTYDCLTLTVYQRPHL